MRSDLRYLKNLNQLFQYKLINDKRTFSPEVHELILIFSVSVSRQLCSNYNGTKFSKHKYLDFYFLMKRSSNSN